MALQAASVLWQPVLHTHIITHTHADTHTHTHACTRTHMRTHAHTYTYLYVTPRLTPTPLQVPTLPALSRKISGRTSSATHARERVRSAGGEGGYLAELGEETFNNS